jgi:N-acetylglutamate synthase-like GNAT family acetyltransferase
MAFTLRWATEEDAPVIKRLVRDAKINPLGIHWQRFIVAEDAVAEGRPLVGIGQVKVHGDGSRELASIATVPDRQGEGIATAIIRALLEANASASAGPLYLTCRTHNEGFYERFGFCRVRDAEGLPPYFRRMVRLMNAAQAVGRWFGMQERGLVMVRKGE